MLVGHSRGHAIRMLAFGDRHVGGRHGPWQTVSRGHAVQFPQQYLREHWSVPRHAQVRDTAFASLTMMEKWGVTREAPTTEALDERR